MLYAIAHFFRDKLPFIWDLIDSINSFLFSVRYSTKLKSIKINHIPEGYKLISIGEIDSKEIETFFACQPQEAFKFFKPHNFDVASIKKLQANKSFLAYLLVDSSNDQIAGYCFNRSFFHGKGFRGRMVDVNYRGKGLGTAMNKILNEIGFGIGLRLYETVSRDNVASYRATVSSSKFKIIEELPGNRVFLEILGNL